MAILIVFFILIFNIQTFASMDGISTETELIGVSVEEIEEQFTYLNWREISEKNFLESNSIIKNLAIAEDCIIVGLEDNKVAILNMEGEYQNGFAFYTTGNYELFYNSFYNAFTVFVWRSQLFYTFDKNGSLIAVEKSDIMHKNLIKYHDLQEYDNSYKIYLTNSVKTPLFNGVNNRIVKENTSGDIEILYEIKISMMNGKILTRIIIACIMVIISGGIICLLLIGSTRRKKIWEKVDMIIKEKTKNDVKKLKKTMLRF